MPQSSQRLFHRRYQPTAVRAIAGLVLGVGFLVTGAWVLLRDLDSLMTALFLAGWVVFFSGVVASAIRGVVTGLPGWEITVTAEHITCRGPGRGIVTEQIQLDSIAELLVDDARGDSVSCVTAVSQDGQKHRIPIDDPQPMVDAIRRARPDLKVTVEPHWSPLRERWRQFLGGP